MDYDAVKFGTLTPTFPGNHSFNILGTQFHLTVPP